MSMNPNDWKNPKNQYRVKAIVHEWADERSTHMDAIKAFGYGGVVTNVNHKQPGHSYDEDCQDFAKIKADLDAHDLPYWIYDENGYDYDHRYIHFPSGFVGGQTLKDHPEMAAKGLYVHRAMAYQPKHYTYHLEDDSDKIVWAAKYPMVQAFRGIPFFRLDYTAMTPVSFTDRVVEADLAERETIFIFAVRTAQEGAQVANTPAVGPYLNMMDPAAIRRFIDLAYEPLAAAVPDAYQDALAVFTDEPSLMVRHMTPGINWSHALVPWVDGLFEAYEQEYGSSLLPSLPLLFEGNAEAYPTRIRFYQLVGKLIGKAYSAQLRDWCAAHGTVFSGHYLGEESMVGHVLDYGSYLEVLKQVGYPGLDILNCIPESHHYNTTKHPQMAARKQGSNGMMVEICPFGDMQNFMKDPVESMSGTMGLLYLSGIRNTNSYFFPNLEEYAPDKLQGVKGPLHHQDAIRFNEYVGRLGSMLDGLDNDCNTFVYYGIESVQARTLPQYTLIHGQEDEDDKATRALTKAIYEAGHDFYYADRDDLTDAAACDGTPMISGHPVKTIIIPKLNVLYDESYEALKTLSSRGVKILFAEQVAPYGTNLPVERAASRTDFTPISTEEVLAWLAESDSDFTAQAEDAMLLKGRFKKDGQELWFIVNNSRCTAKALMNHKHYSAATVYDPVDGSIRRINMGERISIPSLRSTFILFDETLPLGN